MKHVVYKAMVDYEKEERWLNEMAVKGMHFIDYAWCRYLFEEGKPGEFIYRIELLKNHARHPESIAYIRFMEEMGIECVSTYLRWVYFRKKAVDGAFDLFTDYDSKIAHCNKVARVITLAFAANVFAALFNIIIALSHGNAISPINFFVGVVNLVIALISAPAYLSCRTRLKKLKADRQLQE